MTFVLRLCTAVEQTGTAITTRNGQWRRKPPSQVRRDKRRAEQHRARQDNNNTQAQGTQETQKNDNNIEIKASDNDTRFSLFVSTPATDLHSNSVTMSTEDTSCTPRAVRGIDTDLAPCNAVQGACATGVSNVENLDRTVDYFSFSPTSPRYEDVFDIENEVDAAGYDVHVAKLYVAGITGRTTQNLLRKPSRNTKFKNIVFDTGPSRAQQLLLGESDDIIVYDCQQQIVKNWFIKHATTQTERYYRDRLRQCRYVDKQTYRDDLDIMEPDLHFLATLV